MKSIFAILVVSLCLVVSASADLVDFGGTDVDVEGWYGSGANESTLIVDFGDASYAFSYMWSDPGTTSFDMLQGVAAESSFEFAHTDWGWGITVDTMTYDGYSLGEADTWDNGFGFWLSSNGEDWETSPQGVNTQPLSDGSWDGWTYFEPPDEWPGGEPTVPVPEPSTAAMLLMGGAIAVTRRLRKSGGTEE